MTKFSARSGRAIDWCWWPTSSGRPRKFRKCCSMRAWPAKRRIIVLQPRRVAATVAARVTWERNGALRRRRWAANPLRRPNGLGLRICFITEGILLRWLQDNRTLADVGIVLFDEFHERNLLSDVALALVKQLQNGRRPDLKMVVMSATLDAEPV